jgi:cytochrome c oxidase subunit I
MVTYEERLQRIWETPSNLVSQLATVDHKDIGLRYIVTAFIFFLLGGTFASLMRVQLAQPELRVLSPEMYNQIFTMHGVTMIFLFATPMLTGFGNYVLPLMLGTRDMAFPHLNAFGYWGFLLAGIFMYMSFLTGGAPNVGWFNYVPLSDASFSLGVNIEYYTLGLTFLAMSTTAGAINFIVTIFKLRAPGMTLSRMPLFAWAVLVTSFLIVFALPSLTAANLLLELDRNLGTHFFNPLNGGDPILWQHLFWIFGHPDVYIIFLPAVGIVSTIIPVFSRTPITGYLFIALATVTIGFISFGVWVHHMFTVGLLLMPFAFFSAASHMIAIPSGVQVFAWINTIWQGNRLAWKTPFLFVLGFIFTFVLGGITGVMVAIVPFDWLVHDSYFVVAHFHYVLVGGAVFPIFAGLYYWLPKITGRMLSEGLGQLSFWLAFIGFNVAFFPMHISGLVGMPRRIYTYPPGLGWDLLALLSTIGVFILAAGILVFIRRITSALFPSYAAETPSGTREMLWRANITW